MAAFERELRQNLHKLNLLCLLARGMLLSQQCNDPTLLCILLSLTGTSGRGLAPDSALSSRSNIALLKLLKWFQGNVELLTGAVEEACQGEGLVGGMSRPQLMVSLLRCLGLRARLVMVLHPLPLRVPPQRRKKEGEEGVGEGEEAGMGLGEKLLQFNLQQGSLSGVSGAVGMAGGMAGTSGVSKAKGAVNRGMKRGGDEAGTSGGGVASGRQSKKKSKGGGCEEVVSSYFKKQEGGQEEEPKKKKKSTSFKASCVQDTTGPATRKRRHGSTKATPLKKLKQSMAKNSKITPTHDDDLSPQTSSRNAGTPKSAPVSHPGKVGVAELELVGVTEGEETGSWAEVYVPERKKWVCVHLPSCSVDQPQLCEKHSPLPLHYVVAFERCEPLYVYMCVCMYV